MHRSPLVWPDIIGQSKTRDYSTFRFGTASAVQELYIALIDLGDKTGRPIENIILSYDDHADAPNDTSAALYFRWAGSDYAFASDRYHSLEGNIHAMRLFIQHKTQALRYSSLELVRLSLVGFMHPAPIFPEDPA